MVLKAEASNPLSYAQWKEEYGSSPGVKVQGWLGNDGENREDGGAVSGGVQEYCVPASWLQKGLVRTRLGPSVDSGA